MLDAQSRWTGCSIEPRPPSFMLMSHKLPYWYSATRYTHVSRSSSGNCAFPTWIQAAFTHLALVVFSCSSPHATGQRGVVPSLSFVHNNYKKTRWIEVSRYCSWLFEEQSYLSMRAGSSHYVSWFTVRRVHSVMRASLVRCRGGFRGCRHHTQTTILHVQCTLTSRSRKSMAKQ